MPVLAIIPKEGDRKPLKELIEAALGVICGRDMRCAEASCGAKAEAATAPQARSSGRNSRMHMIRPSTLIHQVELQNAIETFGFEFAGPHCPYVREQDALWAAMSTIGSGCQRRPSKVLRRRTLLLL
jgi:hypothetical protein